MLENQYDTMCTLTEYKNERLYTILWTQRIMKFFVTDNEIYIFLLCYAEIDYEVIAVYQVITKTKIRKFKNYFDQ